MFDLLIDLSLATLLVVAYRIDPVAVKYGVVGGMCCAAMVLAVVI